MTADSRGHRLRELALLFLRLGATSFGGPAAHNALMEHEVVRRRGWLDRERFLDLLGAVNLIPGPNSTELAIHLGHLRAGFAGLVVAGTCFILPAMLSVLAIAWAYVRFGSLPEVAGLLYGVKPVILAVVLQALWGLLRSAVKTRLLGVLAAAAAAASAFGVDELLVLLATGAAAMLAGRAARARAPLALLLPWTPLLPVVSAVPFSAGALFWFFLKVGSVLYGSGYVLLAFLRADLVERWHWLTESQLLDAIAVGQVTPGPVFTTATFVGYLLGGPGAGLLATLGIFLPAFVFVALSGPLVPRIRRSPAAGAFLDGVNAASLALMAVVTWRLSQDAVIDATTLLFAAVAAALLWRSRVNSTWLVLGGGALGVVVALLRR